MHRPELQSIPDGWETMRDEMKSIKAVYTDIRRYKTADYDDLNKHLYDAVVACEGWSGVFDMDDKWWNFPLFTYGEPTKPARKLAPKTIEILEKVGGVSFAAFSLLLPMGILVPHWDKPASDLPAGSLTYHLGLDCPEFCYLIQGDKAISEQNGKFFNFTCSEIHSAVNLSDQVRVIMYMTFTQ